MLLKGIKVLDLSNLLPGPMCSLFLADLGAEVIKVESLYGDPMRMLDSADNKSPYFKALNRNKKSITLNLKTYEGKKIFLKLAREADVIIEGFRPGKVNALGVGYTFVKKVNPKIIYCSITGYGQKGPYKNKAGHDLNYASLAGLLDVISKKPLVPGIQIADVGCALIAAFSIVACLYYRQVSGKGNYIDVPVLGSSLALIGIHIAHRSDSKKTDTILSGAKACYSVYETKDHRFVSLGAVETKFWTSFCNAAKRKDLIKRQFDGTGPFIKEMRRIFKNKTLKDWICLNDKYDFCCEPVKDIKEVLEDKHLQSRKSIIELDGLRQVALPFNFSCVKKLDYLRAPNLGEHTRHILKNIGYSKRQIDEFRRNKII